MTDNLKSQMTAQLEVIDSLATTIAQDHPAADAEAGGIHVAVRLLNDLVADIIDDDD